MDSPPHSPHRRRAFWWLVVACVAGVAHALLVTGADEGSFWFEVSLSASKAGRVQVYFDRGSGLSEADSASMPIAAERTPTLVRLRIPAGTYTGFRFDPINTDATVTFSAPRIASGAGRVLRRFRPEEFQAGPDVERIVWERDTARLATTPGHSDPQFNVPLQPPLALRAGLREALLDRLRVCPRFVLGWVALATLILFCAEIGRRLDPSARTAWFIWSAAGVATLVAAYPVVFAGRSFVGPDKLPLVYSTPPLLPGAPARSDANVRAGDPSAMMWQHLTYGAVQSRALHVDRELPIWNRFISCGTPLLGQGQSMAGDPLHGIVLAANNASWAWDLKFLLARLLFAAGVGWTVFYFTGGLFGAALAAVAAAFVGLFNFRFNHPATFTLCYSPWVLGAWARAFARGKPASPRLSLALWMVANLAVAGSGTVKETAAVLVAFNGLGVLIWAAEARTRGRIARELVTGLVVAALFAAITAPLWVTFQQALRSAITSSDQALVWQAPRAWVIGLFDALFYHELNDAHLEFLPSGNFLILLGLVLAVGSRAWSAPGRKYFLLLLLALVPAILTGFEFVPKRWILAIPGLRSAVHVHDICSALAVVLCAILAGFGFSALADDPARRLSRVGTIVALALIGFGVAAYFRDTSNLWLTGPGFAGLTGGLNRHRFFFVTLGVVLVAWCGLVVVVRRGNAPASWGSLRVLAAVGCCVPLLYRNGLHLNYRVGASYLTTPPARADLTLPSAALDAIRTDARREPGRLVATGTTLMGNLPALYACESINGADALLSRTYREFVQAAGLIGPSLSDWRFTVTNDTLKDQLPALSLMGVRYIVAEQPIPEVSGVSAWKHEDLHVYRHDGAWPRAFFTETLLTYATVDDFVALVRRHRATPFGAVQSAAGAATAANEANPGPCVPAKRYRLTANTTAFTIVAPRAGYVVLSETFLSGSARVLLNGEAAEVLRANHTFQAVRIPAAGTFEVEVRYTSPATKWALLASAVGLGLFVVQVVRARPESTDKP